ncbi:MAG: hypothetical protein LAN18_06460 [Acidobacteriia bacterium]|nr:hypothetical protein [Terriglobia bacterium]
MKLAEKHFATTNELWSAVEKFCVWLDQSEGLSYDPYDVFGTRYGRWARRLYYRKHPLGVITTAPVILMEVVCPGLRALLVNKDRFPTADAQLSLAFLNLYEACQEQPNGNMSGHASEDRSPLSWLIKAKDLANDLLKQSVPGYSGFCWGYPFDWQHVNGLMLKGTPHITATPYCYEVFTRLFDLTGEKHYLEMAHSIAGFVFDDLKDTPTGNNAAASSYTPHDHSKVINASAYRAFVLFDAAQRFQEETYRAKAQKNLQFILQTQRPDGSWLYAIDSPPEAFIDHFHTCFVLKNLHKINCHLQSDEVKRAVQNGYEYYRKALFDGEDNPKTYAVAPRVEIVRLEMYNVAEAITLGILLRNDIPEAFALAKRLATRLITQYQLPSGHWVTRIYRGGIRHTVPFLRWPQSQLFLAVTNLLLALEQSERMANYNSNREDRYPIGAPCATSPVGRRPSQNELNKQSCK